MQNNSNLLLYDISHIGDYNNLFKNDYKRIATTSSQYRKKVYPSFMDEKVNRLPSSSSLKSKSQQNSTRKPYHTTETFYETTYPQIANRFGNHQESYFTKQFENPSSSKNYFENIYKNNVSSTHLFPGADFGRYMLVKGTSQKINGEHNSVKIEQMDFENTDIFSVSENKEPPLKKTNKDLKNHLVEICQKIHTTYSLSNNKTKLKQVKSIQNISESKVTTLQMPAIKTLSPSNSEQLAKCESTLSESFGSAPSLLPGKSHVSIFDYGDSSDESPNRQQETEFLTSSFFIRSNFVNVPPTIHFTNDHREGSLLENNTIFDLVLFNRNFFLIFILYLLYKMYKNQK